MPCYTPPEKASETESRKVAKLILILDKKLGNKEHPAVKIWSQSFYENKCDILTPMLCDKIRSLSPELREQIIYDAHDKDSRKLADWWDDHKEFDKKRNAP